MYSQYFFKMNELIHSYCTYTGTSCLSYDRKLGLIYITSYSRKRFYVTCGIIILTTIICDVRTFKLYYMGDDETQTVFPLCYIFSLITTLLSFALGYIMLLIDQFKSLINQTYRFASDFQGTILIQCLFYVQSIFTFKAV
jgi:hypothetical protein